MRKKMNKPWRKPNLNDVWEIDEIDDRNLFMKFVINEAPTDSTWIVGDIWEKETIDHLQPFTTKQLVSKLILGIFIKSTDEIMIQLSETTKEKLNTVLPKLNFSPEFIEQHIYKGTEMFMVSYDNLCPCWLSNSISQNILERASKSIGFKYYDPSNA
jgi:hypothetical protein